MTLTRPALATVVAVVLTATLGAAAWWSGALATAATRPVTWTTVAPSPVATLEASGIEVGSKFYLFGGYDVPKIPTYTPTARSYVYNPATNVWSSIAPLPAFNGTGQPGDSHIGIATDGTDIYLAGGYSSNAAGTGQIFGAKDVYRYNVAANTYTRLPDLPLERAAGAMGFVGGMLHYVGGVDRSRKVEATQHWALDPDNLSAGWVTRAALPSPRNHPGATVLGGKLYLVGGQVGQDQASTSSAVASSYDPVTNSWKTLPPMPKALSHTVTTTLDGQVVTLGGQTAYNVNSASVYSYDPAANVWNTLTSLPASRFAGTVGQIGGKIYFSGGSNQATTYRGTPQMLPTSPVATTSTPPASTPPATTPPPTGAGVVRIDAGSSVNTVDSAGNTWLADTGRFSPSTLAASGSPTTAIAGTNDDAIYATNRSNLGSSTPQSSRVFSYAVPITASKVSVRLLFAENYWTVSGKRKFDVSVEGTKLISGLDIVAASGAINTALERTLTGITVADGVVNLAFQASVDFPSISGIEVTCTAGCSTTTPTTPDPSTPPVARIDAGSTSATVDAAGNTWQPDTALFSPSALAAGGSTATAIDGTSDDVIYATNRSNLGSSTPLADRNFEYAIPTSATQVTVRLLFSESYWTVANKRRFDVYAEGAKVVSNLDLYAATGAKNKALDRTIAGIAVTGGVLNLKFQALADFPLISGIQVTCTAGC